MPAIKEKAFSPGSFKLKLLCQRFFVPVNLAAGKAVSFNFIDMRDNHEGFRINPADFLIEFGELAVGDDCHDYRLV